MQKDDTIIALKDKYSFNTKFNIILFNEKTSIWYFNALYDNNGSGLCQFIIIKCNPSCIECNLEFNTSTHQCTECAHLYFKAEDLEHNCYNDETKPLGYYFDSESQSYRKCYKSCATCSKLGDDDQHDCITCVSPYKPLSDIPSQCVGSLPSGYFEEENVYKKCHENCLSCFSTGTKEKNNCIECNPDIKQLVHLMLFNAYVSIMK